MDSATCSAVTVCGRSESEGLGSALDAGLKQDGYRPPDGKEYSTVLAGGSGLKALAFP